jgi:hypothetical protein
LLNPPSPCPPTTPWSVAIYDWLVDKGGGVANMNTNDGVGPVYVFLFFVDVVNGVGVDDDDVVVVVLLFMLVFVGRTFF